MSTSQVDHTLWCLRPVCSCCAGADLQALSCGAVLAAGKRDQPLLQCTHQPGSNLAGESSWMQELHVEEGDWSEALRVSGPPCSQREAEAVVAQGGAGSGRPTCVTTCF